MCFDSDSHPPIPPIAGGAVDTEDVVLHAADGANVAAFLARAETPSGAAIVVLPDVRGLYRYYEELALRFAEAGVDAIAIDYFARSAGPAPHQRPADFDFMARVAETRFATLSADVAAAVARLREPGLGRARAVFTVGFCFGGRLSFVSSTLGLGLAGVIGFYGWPVGASRNDVPAPADSAGAMRSPVLGLFGGADQGISADAVAIFGRALEAAAVEHDVVTYPGAPHSFFDRKADDFADASADAWARVLAFVTAHTPPA